MCNNTQILKFVDLSKTRKSKCLENKTFFFFSNKKIHSVYIKTYHMIKNSFLAEVDFELKQQT